MNRTRWRYSALFLLLGCGVKAGAQQALSWKQVHNRFENNNPTLLAGQFNISESKAQEITAYLRPNPNFTATADQIDPFPGGPPHGPFAFFLPVASIN
jgi:cobalt-zinc-cadmium efflux system outer membrane protein